MSEMFSGLASPDPPPTQLPLMMYHPTSCGWDLPIWWPGGKTTEAWLPSAVSSVETPISLPYQTMGVQAVLSLQCHVSTFGKIKRSTVQPGRKTLVFTSFVFLESLKWCFWNPFHLAIWKGDLIHEEEKEKPQVSPNSNNFDSDDFLLSP